MIKLISLLALFSSLLFSSVLASSIKEFSALFSVVNNDCMMKILLMHVEKDLKLRLISKTFMKAFDGLCSDQLLLLDPRIKFLTHDEDGHTIISPIGTFLPKSVPLFMLYTSYLNVLDKKSFDEKFPVSKIPENASLELESRLNSEYNRLIEMLRSFIELEYCYNSKYRPTIMRTCRLYCLLVATFSEQTFIEKIVTSIDFPVERLVFYAASGKLKAPFDVKILSRFNINSQPKSLLIVVGVENLDLVRAIIKNPQNDLVILSNHQFSESRTVMHLAAIKGNVEIINLLLERGFSVDVKGDRGIRPIHLAASCGKYDAVVRLFEFDKDVTSSPRKLNYSPAPIVLAAEEGHTKIVEFFLSQATVDMTKNRETSRLLIKVALLRKDAKLGKLLIDSAKVRLTVAEIKKLRSLK